MDRLVNMLILTKFPAYSNVADPQNMDPQDK